jgi:hypothetical protein
MGTLIDSHILSREGNDGAGKEGMVKNQATGNNCQRTYEGMNGALNEGVIGNGANRASG